MHQLYQLINYREQRNGPVWRGVCDGKRFVRAVTRDAAEQIVDTLRRSYHNITSTPQPPSACCEAHQGLTDIAARHDVVLEENRRKNITFAIMCEIAEVAPAPDDDLGTVDSLNDYTAAIDERLRRDAAFYQFMHDYRWMFDTDRSVIVTHPLFRRGEALERLQLACDERFGYERVRVV